MSPSPSPRRTRAKNGNTHPGDAIPKRNKRTKAEIEAAKEAAKLLKKKKEVEKQRKLTNIAQATDDIVVETQALEASEPRGRPKPKPHPLKRTYAMMNVLEESDKENQPGAESEAGAELTDFYEPSGGSESESIDPASESDTQHREAQVVKPLLKKKRGRKKASVLNEIQKRRQHLDPILEGDEAEQEMEEQEKAELMANVNELPRGTHGVQAESQGRLPFKAGLKKSWMSQRNVTTEPTQTVLAPKPSKRGTKGSGVAADPLPINPVPVPMATKRATKSLMDSQPIHEPIAVPKAGNKAKTSNSAVKFSTGVLENPQPQADARPRHVSTVSLASQAEVPETPLAPTARRLAVAAPQATPVNVGTGIPDDESDTEEHTAAKSSPIKAGIRITSNAIVSIRPAGQAGMTGVRKPFPAPKVNQAAEEELEQGNERASVAPSEQPRGSSRSQSATYDCLPHGVLRNTFKEVYLPTVAKYLAKLPNDKYPNAWSTSSPDFLIVIQAVWNEVFPTVPYTFVAQGRRCDVIRLITQRIYEWRGKFASAAVEAVLDLEASNEHYQNPDIRKDWIAWATTSGLWPFLYADNSSEDPKRWFGTFASPLITQAFAPHVAFTAQAIVIRRLNNLEAEQPSGALALATVAAERALTLWDQGDFDNWRMLRDREKPSLAKFDAGTWAKKTQAWYMSILTLTPQSWKDIVDLACEHIKPTSRKQPVSRVAEDVDNRAVIIARPML